MKVPSKVPPRADRHNPLKICRLSSRHLSATVIGPGAALQSLTLRRPGAAPIRLVRDLGAAAAYLPNPTQVGAVVGRVAGRIRRGRFPLAARQVRLARNDGVHTLHGGPAGFGQVVWRWAGGSTFCLRSPHGDQGFPGQVTAAATYSLPQPLTLRLDLTARSRTRTPINLTHHPYWRLFTPHLTLHGDQAQRVDAALIPLGGYAPVSLALDQALDHCVLVPGAGMRPLARLDQRGAGFAMTVWSDASHVQVYNGYPSHLCLEPQSANDALNVPDEPSNVLRPRCVWTRRIEYRFEI